MSKFYGSIGFSVSTKTAPGVFTPSITERQYKGDVLSNTRRYEAQTNSTNDDLLINNKIMPIIIPGNGPASMITADCC